MHYSYSMDFIKLYYIFDYYEWCDEEKWIKCNNVYNM